MPEPLIPGGYILLSRKIIESQIWSKPPLYLKVWIYLLTHAQHKEYKGLKRGQLRTSIPEIQETCSWYVGFRKVTPTKDQIYQVLEWLRTSCAHNDESNTKATMIATTKATQGIIINILNYGIYQDSKNYESNADSNDEKAMNPTREQREPNNINKNVKNDKNDKKIKYADFVTMTQEEYQKLLTQFGERGTSDRIEKLSLYKGSTGKKYASDYLTILSWERKNKEKSKPSQTYDDIPVLTFDKPTMYATKD